ncbi:MAG: ATP-binding protein [Firmicutes bacterium]|nr:ATP-binding protein [Bacillota bacterium]
MAELTIDAKTENLPQVFEFIEESLEGCPFKLVSQMNLVAEEIFVNIASYAYKDKEGKAIIKVDVDNNTLTLIFEDSGVPFDPLQKEDPDTSANAEERQIGGLGIFLAKKLTDSMEYENKDGVNRLLLTKKF